MKCCDECQGVYCQLCWGSGHRGGPAPLGSRIRKALGVAPDAPEEVCVAAILKLKAKARKKADE